MTTTIVLSELVITDGTNRVSLIAENEGGPFFLEDWTPGSPQYKGGGTYSSSSLSDGRVLVDKKFDNVLETFPLKVRADGGTDSIIRTINKLRELLEQATDYWVDRYETTFVWIEAKACGETNKRYAVVHGYSAPNDDNPYGRSFHQPGGAKLYENFNLTIERGHWQDVQPGTSTCMTVSGRADARVLYLDLGDRDLTDADTTYQVIAFCDPASLQDMHNGPFTAEGWFYITGWGSDDAAILAHKGTFDPVPGPPPYNIATGWSFHIEDGRGLVGQIAFDVQDYVRYSTTSFTSALFNGWHHYALSYDDAGLTMRMFIDGVEVTYDGTQNPGGAIVSDVGDDGGFAAQADCSAPADINGDDPAHTGGKVGWCRLTADTLYTANFTPPDRCRLPEIDGDTLAVYNWGQNYGTDWDVDRNVYNWEGTAAADAELSDRFYPDYGYEACSEIIGGAEVCADVGAYFTNHNKNAMINQVLLYDASAGTFSANYHDTDNHDLFPDPYNQNDIIYFGIDDSEGWSGPFSSLVFDVDDVNTDFDGNIAWEYWNGGGWVALTTVDNTENFQETGVNSVHWQIPNAWASTAINGVTAYWVRCRYTPAVAGNNPPTQNNRPVYTISWNHINIPADQTYGNIDALLKGLFRNWAENSGALAVDHFIMGTRTVSRGSSFRSTINLIDEPDGQNAPGVTIPVGGVNTTFIAEVQSPTGYKCQYNPPGATALTQVLEILIDIDHAPDYFGKFHVYLRAEQNGGSAEDCWFNLAFGQMVDGISVHNRHTTDTVYTTSTGAVVLYDMGEVFLPPIGVEALDESFAMGIQLNCGSSSGTPNMWFYDLILIPVDEWSAVITDHTRDVNASYVKIDFDLVVDGLDLPKVRARSYVKGVDDLFEIDPVRVLKYGYQAICTQPVLKPGVLQKLHIVTGKYDQTDDDHNSDFEASLNARLYAVNRYMTSRGDE